MTVSTQLDIAANVGGGQRVISDPSRQYVVGGPWGAFSMNGGLLLAQVEDDVVRQFGPRVYELMEHDSAVSAALWMLKAGALADGLRLTPKVRAEEGEIVSQRARKAAIKLSAEVYESCERAVNALSDEVHAALYALLDSLVYGCSAAETVFTLAEDGEDRGRQMPTAIQVKPRWAWAFRCDVFLKVLRLRAWTTEGWADIDRNKFVVLSWMPKDGDPRGSSLLRACYTPWNVKQQAYPDYGEYLRKFASASLVLTAGENMQDRETIDPTTGTVVTQTVQQQLVNAGLEFRNHSVLGLPAGCSAEIVRSSGTGAAFLEGFERFEREIFRTVILSTRPMQEAKHGSKADSESGLDIFGMAVAQVRKPLAGAFRKDFLRRYVELNWGPAVAADHTPDCGFGASDHVGPELMAAFANAWGHGLFTAEQKPFIWAKLGVPTPPGWSPEDDDEPDPEASAAAGAGSEDGSEDGGPADDGTRPEPEPGAEPEPEPADTSKPEPTPPPKPARKKTPPGRKAVAAVGANGFAHAT